MSRLILIILVLTAVIVTSRHDALAAYDARLNAALQQGRVWLGLESPEVQTAESYLDGKVTDVASVQGQVAPVARASLSAPLVSIAPQASRNLGSSATIRMLDNLTQNREGSGARFVKVAP